MGRTVRLLLTVAVAILLLVRVQAATADIGNTTTGGSPSTDTATNTLVGTVYAAPSSGTTPATIHAYIKSSDGSSIGWKCGVYATSGGSPASQALLSNTVELRTTSTSYVDVNGSLTGFTPVSGTSYTLACKGESSLAQIAYDSTLSVYYFTDAYVSALAATYSASPSTAANVAYRLWVNYTQSGGSGCVASPLSLSGMGKC